MQLFNLTGLVLSLFDLVGKNPGHAFDRLSFPCAHLGWVELPLGRNLLNRLVTAQRLSSATVALKLSEKFRRFVILVSIRSCWIHLSTLSSFAGPLHFFWCDLFTQPIYTLPSPSAGSTLTHRRRYAWRGLMP
ncbi:hypothetical protein OAN307_c40200 [Octadecabacter antarcticus 307]|uniref:Uncharacterized protein n=1 Tax=Octadecabacter antarcticus 307 TaxID=391626 RepID=M9RGD3_9RHOB|nr:hypothetical protein OAN307_c40200 [Octadecabacter antarcticus 307]